MAYLIFHRKSNTSSWVLWRRVIGNISLNTGHTHNRLEKLKKLILFHRVVLDFICVVCVYVCVYMYIYTHTYTHGTENRCGKYNKIKLKNLILYRNIFTCNAPSSCLCCVHLIGKVHSLSLFLTSTLFKRLRVLYSTQSNREWVVSVWVTKLVCECCDRNILAQGSSEHVPENADLDVLL